MLVLEVAVLRVVGSQDHALFRSLKEASVKTDPISEYSPSEQWGSVAVRAARLGLRPVDLAQELEMDPRRLRRIASGRLPVPPWMSATVQGWAQEVDDQARRAADHLIDAAGQSPVVLWRYPSKRLLALHEGGFKARSAETWDAHLLQIMRRLDARGLSYVVLTKGIDAAPADPSSLLDEIFQPGWQQTQRPPQSADVTDHS